MRKMAMVLVAVIALGIAGGGCGGPYYLAGNVEDWYAQKYGETPWLWGNIIVNGLFTFVHGFAWFADAIVLNTYYFWLKDAQPGGDGKGTYYEHKKPSSGKAFPK